MKTPANAAAPVTVTATTAACGAIRGLGTYAEHITELKELHLGPTCQAKPSSK